MAGFAAVARVLAELAGLAELTTGSKARVGLARISHKACQRICSAGLPAGCSVGLPTHAGYRLLGHGVCNWY